MRTSKLIWTLSLLSVVVCSAVAQDQDPGWPRRHEEAGNVLINYQPQVDDWNNFSNITWREAFQLTPAGGKMVLGAAKLSGTTSVDNEKHMVTIYGIQLLDAYFPDLSPETSAKMKQLLLSFIPPVVNISLERVVAYVPKPQTTASTVELKNDPPFIFVSYKPAVLLHVDGEPSLAPIAGTKLKYVVNTQWALFLDTQESVYYLLVGDRWLSARDLHGPWAAVTKLPKDMDKLPKEAQWQPLGKVIPPPQSTNPIPTVFYSTVPAEVILFDGKPDFGKIPETQLVYATNTDSPVFVYTPTNEYYYLTAGRWFRSKNLEGTWEFASSSLPPDFAKIPPYSPASAILSSVPGTEEAKDAVLIAQIPTTMVIDPKTAAAQAKVEYTGSPQFSPIQGTSMQYATNTADKVIQVGDVYYLCLQGVWFMSTTPQGPWTAASTVPQVIYSIPPSSPVYNVTYVTQVTTSDGNIQSSYTAGYMGGFVTGLAVGAIVCSGTGYYYPPYIGYPAYGYPVYHPYPTPYGGMPYYNSATGAYGVSQTTYGPNGSTTRAASYNPYTGTYKQGTSVTTPYGRQSAGQAYNPYTGTYGATHQGSSPTAQWGQSYVSNGNKSATAQHYSTAQGTTASVQGSQGGHGYAAAGPGGNSAFAGKNSQGDMYAGHDGNVYQNTGSGWQKYNNSSNSWQNVNTQQAQQQAHQQAQSYEQQHPQSQQNVQNYEQQHPNAQANAQQHEQNFNQERSSGNMSSENLNSEMQNRQRGSTQAENYQRGGSSGGWGGGGRSWGGGGGRRR